MYKYISRDDCYYTDTDSAVLGNPLPEDEISSTELGKVKLEYRVNTGILLAAKNYLLQTDTDGDIIKHGGATKDRVDASWYLSQYANPYKKKRVAVDLNFLIDWKTLDIAKKKRHVLLGLQVDSKRDSVFDDNSIWVSTTPKDVIDLRDQERACLRFEVKILEEKLSKQQK